jgi:hypothetical protein
MSSKRSNTTCGSFDRRMPRSLVATNWTTHRSDESLNSPSMEWPNSLLWADADPPSFVLADALPVHTCRTPKENSDDKR